MTVKCNMHLKYFELLYTTVLQLALVLEEAIVRLAIVSKQQLYYATIVRVVIIRVTIPRYHK